MTETSVPMRSISEDVLVDLMPSLQDIEQDVGLAGPLVEQDLLNAEEDWLEEDFAEGAEFNARRVFTSSNADAYSYLAINTLVFRDSGATSRSLSNLLRLREKEVKVMDTGIARPFVWRSDLAIDGIEWRLAREANWGESLEMPMFVSYFGCALNKGRLAVFVEYGYLRVPLSDGDWADRACDFASQNFEAVSTEYPILIASDIPVTSTTIGESSAMLGGIFPQVNEFEEISRSCPYFGDFLLKIDDSIQSSDDEISSIEGLVSNWIRSYEASTDLWSETVATTPEGFGPLRRVQFSSRLLLFDSDVSARRYARKINKDLAEMVQVGSYSFARDRTTSPDGRLNDYEFQSHVAADRPARSYLSSNGIVRGRILILSDVIDSSRVDWSTCLANLNLNLGWGIEARLPQVLR